MGSKRVGAVAVPTLRASPRPAFRSKNSKGRGSVSPWLGHDQTGQFATTLKPAARQKRFNHGQADMRDRLLLLPSARNLSRDGPIQCAAVTLALPPDTAPSFKPPPPIWAIVSWLLPALLTCSTLLASFPPLGQTSGAHRASRQASLLTRPSRKHEPSCYPRTFTFLVDLVQAVLQ